MRERDEVQRLELLPPPTPNPTYEVQRLPPTPNPTYEVQRLELLGPEREQLVRRPRGRVGQVPG